MGINTTSDFTFLLPSYRAAKLVEKLRGLVGSDGTVSEPELSETGMGFMVTIQPQYEADVLRNWFRYAGGKFIFTLPIEGGQRVKFDVEEIKS